MNLSKYLLVKMKRIEPKSKDIIVATLPLDCTRSDADRVRQELGRLIDAFLQTGLDGDVTFVIQPNGTILQKKEENFLQRLVKRLGFITSN